MAAGINILVNDGGAPARIMKVGNAGADIDAGHIVEINSSGKVVVASEDLPSLLHAIGVLFVDATSGDPASVLTGSGVIVYLKATGTIAAGDKLGHDAAGLAKAATTGDERFAIALEAKATSGTHSGFVKALLL